MQENRANNPVIKDMQMTGLKLFFKKKLSDLTEIFPVKKYIRGKFLGKGGFAKCYDFINLENKRVSSAKIIDKASLTKSRVK